MREIFSLVGTIALDGIDSVNNSLTKIDKEGKKLARQMKKTGRQVATLGKDFTKLVSGPVAALGAGMIALSNQTGKYADQLLDMKEITGLSTDTLQEMEHVARIAGVEFKGLTNSIQKFQGRLPQIIDEGGRAYEAIEQLGINVFDASGNVRDMNDLFPAMITGLNGIENTTERNSIAQQIFGRQMKDLAPVLGLTADEFESARKEAHELGLVMSEDALNAANDYRKETEKLGAEFKAVGRNIATEFMPILKDTVIPIIREQIIPLIVSFANKVQSLGEWFSGLSPNIQEMIVKIVAFSGVAGPLLIVAGKLISTFSILAPAIIAVKTAFIALTSVMIANPYVLAAVAIGGVALAIHKTGNAWAKWRDEIGNDVAEKQTKAVKSALEEVIPLYGKLANADKELIPEDEYRAKKKRIGELEKTLSELGVEIDYNAGMATKLTQANNRLTDIELEVTDAINEETEAVKKNSDEEEEAAKKKKKLREEEIRAAQAKKDARIQFEQDWTDRLLLETATRLDALELEKEKAIGEAEKMEADTTAIKEYYSKKRQDIIDEEAEQEKKKNEEVARKREEFEAEWTLRYESHNADRSQILEMQKNAALEKADELGASREAILQYYAERESELMQQNAWNMVNTFTDAINQISSLFSRSTEKRISQIDEEAKRQKEKATQTITNEKQLSQTMQKIDEEADKKKKALQQEQSKREKASGIFGIIVSTAQAIMKSYEQLGPIAGTVAAVLMGAIGAAQIATVASEPIPMERGAFVQNRPGGVLAQIGEGKQNELVMPMKTGMQQLTEGIVNGLSGGDGGGGNSITNSEQVNIYLEINSPAFDRSTLVDLERSLRGIRIDESRRLVLA
jgi:hypothetical protein